MTRPSIEGLEVSGGSARVSGVLALESVASLLGALEPLLARGEISSLDVTAARSPDSAALAFLFACRRRAAAHGRALHISALPQALTALAALYGVDALFRA